MHKDYQNEHQPQGLPRPRLPLGTQGGSRTTRGPYSGTWVVQWCPDNWHLGFPWSHLGDAVPLPGIVNIQKPDVKWQFILDLSIDIPLKMVTFNYVNVHQRLVCVDCLSAWLWGPHLPIYSHLSEAEIPYPCCNLVTSTMSPSCILKQQQLYSPTNERVTAN